MKKLSIIILSYNTVDLLRGCLKSLEKVSGEVDFEIIVVDNASSDGSVSMVEKYFPEVVLIKNPSNIGFGRGNNSAKEKVKGEYVLFLNSDTEVHKGTLARTMGVIENDTQVGVVTCKMFLKNGNLDRDARRSFPTPWVSLTHFSGLDKVFPTSPVFAKYWYGAVSPDITQEIEVAQGAFFLSRKEVLDAVGWFDEDYFLDGEDIDLCWKIKQKDYKVIYFPQVSILHLKKASKKSYSKLQRIRFALAGVDSMQLFYKKRLQKKYPMSITLFVFLGINVIKILRFIKVVLS